MSGISLTIGGESRMVASKSISDLVTELSLAPDGRGIAVAVNDEVVSKSRWSERKLHDGDKIEIVKAVQGG